MGLRKPLVLAVLLNSLLTNFRNKKPVMFIDTGTMGVLPPKSGLVMEGAELSLKKGILCLMIATLYAPVLVGIFSNLNWSTFSGLADVV